jgi:UDP-N-acetylmuramate: L-alanyl-gamma-D-glutamyl-meso-diaminopimelate ligase
LNELEIHIDEGYEVQTLKKHPDLVIIGNALSRGNPSIEYVLNNQIPYISGPEWLKQNVLHDRFVIAIAGTHGKTTVSSLVAWLLDSAGLNPGFLIGGVPENFGVSARLGQSKYFIIEADEYDTAFFDKRSKFVHYQPNVLVINNLEYDHSDIFDNIQDIIKQFHHLVRTMAADSVILFPSGHPEIEKVIKLGCWSKVQRFGSKQDDAWVVDFRKLLNKKLILTNKNAEEFKISTPLMGIHNAWNVTAAISVLAQVESNIQPALNKLASFTNVSRRLQLVGMPNDITIYDDFAHHPSAIEASLKAIKKHVNPKKLIAVLEVRSNTMVMGLHKTTLAEALKTADSVLILKPNSLKWDLADAMKTLPNIIITELAETIVQKVSAVAEQGDSVLIMSNGASENLPKRIVEQIKKTEGI